METILLYIVFFSINILLINFCKIVSAPVSGGCHNAIGGQGQLGCMRPVCHRSSSELQINVCTTVCSRMLPHCHGWAWLIRSCLAGTVVGWLVPNGVVASSSPVKDRTALQTNGLPKICSSSGAASAGRSRRSS